MRWPGALLTVTTIAFLSATYVARAFQARDPAALKGPPYERPSTGSYVGSQACQSCHESAYDTWRKTLHVQMTKPIAEARVEGDFGFSYGSRGPTPPPQRSRRANAPPPPAPGAAGRVEAFGPAGPMEARGGRALIPVPHNK